MKQQRKTYTKDFKLETVRLYESSQKSAAQIEADLDLASGIIHKWRRRLKASGQQAFVGKGYQSELEAEIKRLRRELEVARQERDILKAAVVFFTKEYSPDSPSSSSTARSSR
jgi:transposase